MPKACKHKTPLKEAEQREHFERLWALHPQKLGKKQAWCHYRASVKEHEDQIAIEAALKRFIAYHTAKATDPTYIPRGKTWFNNWRDWIDYEEPTLGGKAKRERPYFFADRFDGGRTMYVLVKTDGTRKTGDPFEQERWFNAGVPHAKELDRV
jgi:hypothetical protein